MPNPPLGSFSFVFYSSHMALGRGCRHKKVATMPVCAMYLFILVLTCHLLLFVRIALSDQYPDPCQLWHQKDRTCLPEALFCGRLSVAHD